MANATIGALRVSLGLDSAAFTEGLSAAQRHLKGVSQKLQSVGKIMATVGAGMSAGITAPLLALGSMAVNEASEMRDALGQVGAAITSMGDVSGRSLEQLQAQADKLAGSSLFEDDQILRGVTANLLTFGNVAGEQFDRAQQAAVDLSARLGQDLQASTIMVGKALNDPILGLTALRRVGIQFTAEQEAQIKAMTGVGNVAGAQAIMLSELERQFGGSAAAARNAAQPMERVRLALAAMAGDIGKYLLPIGDKLAAFITGLTERFGNLSPRMQKFVVIAGGIAAALGPVLIVAGAAVAAIGALIPVIAAIGAPVLAVGAAVAGLVAVFYLFRDDIVPVVTAFGEAVRETLGPKLAPLWEALKGAVQSIGAVFAQIFGNASADGIAPVLIAWGQVVARIFGAALDLITGALNIITNLFNAFGSLLRGDFSGMWGYLWEAVKAAVSSIANAFQTLFPNVIGWVQKTYEGVKAWLLDKFTGLVGKIGDKVAAVGDFFHNLWDRVVGHSYIPDMVNAIGEWMGPRLQSAMVDPAWAAANDTASAFEGAGSAITDTWDGVFKSIATKDWKGALSGLFDALGQQGGVLGKLGGLGGAILSALPGFATGGSFKVGGSGGVDSQLTAFRTTPGEMVDIRKPGQMRDDGALAVHVSPSPYFDVQVQKVARPMVDQGMKRAVSTSTTVARRSLPGAQGSQRRLGTI